MFKKFFNIILLAFLWNSIGYSQFISNPGFENKAGCFPDVDSLSAWFLTGNDAFVFDSCNTASFGYNNDYGSQLPFSGDAYAGFACEEQFNPVSFAGLLSIALPNSLAPGTEYRLSFYLALADSSRFATNAVGAFLSTGLPSYSNARGVQVDDTHISTGLFATSKAWVQVNIFFTPDSAYNYVSIGKPFDSTVGELLEVCPTCPDDIPFYYIDNVGITTVESISRRGGSFNKQAPAVITDIYGNPQYPTYKGIQVHRYPDGTYKKLIVR